jgi:hypothetical protein
VYPKKTPKISKIHPQTSPAERAQLVDSLTHNPERRPGAKQNASLSIMHTEILQQLVCSVVLFPSGGNPEGEQAA